jgi:threonine dehydrogenase-like Zn-dependent dehydrogenase
MVELKKGKMNAVRWEGKPFSVSVREVDIPKIIDPLDAIVRITSAAICGSELHTYRGRLPTKHPMTFGHENMGIIEEVGEKVTTLNKGDRVLVGAGIGKITDFGEIGQGLPGEPISYGIGEIEPGALVLDGGQAQFMRVPFANANLLILPPGNKHELDYLLLADIWPTAWYALECAGQVLGDTIVVFGAGALIFQLVPFIHCIANLLAGPVGLLCAYSAILRGAIKVYSVDEVPERLAKAKGIGAIPINFKDGDPVAQILKFEPNGVDRACDCVGFEAVDSNGKNVENIIITQAINVTRPSGGIGFIGAYFQVDNSKCFPTHRHHV